VGEPINDATDDTLAIKSSAHEEQRENFEKTTYRKTK
jgi:hypothetical protein